LLLEELLVCLLLEPDNNSIKAVPKKLKVDNKDFKKEKYLRFMRNSGFDQT
jgi:hypothetical protein